MRGEDDTFSMEYPCSSPQEERWFLMRVVPLRLSEGGCVISHSDITGLKLVERDLINRKRALRESREDYRTLARKLLNATEEARRRLAREIHDDLSQRLAVLSMDAGKLAESEDVQEEGAAALQDIRQRMESLSEDMHAIARQLHPSILDDLGLDEALASACSFFSDHLGIEVEYRGEDIPDALRPEVSLNMYRIVQEALSNVGKHAGAGRVEVALVGEGGALQLSIRDDGVGFREAEIHRAPGLGLASMRERVNLIGGTLVLETAPGRGTEIRVTVPLSRGRTETGE
jgi:signal transduction histidine kinase